MRRFALLAAAAALLGASAAAAKSPPFVGVWKGTVKTSAGATTPVVVTLTTKLKSNNSGTVAYGTPKCTGRLAFLKQSGRVLTLRETITRGTCTRGGAIQLTQIDFRTLWLEWWGTGATEATWKGYVTLGGR